MESGSSTGGKFTDDLDSPGTTVVNINVKFASRSIPICISADSTVKDLKSLLQPLTNILPRGQKLIFKGKVLVDATTLRSSEVTNGSKIMLMASQGLHQGDGPIKNETPAARSSILRPSSAKRTEHEKIKASVDKSRLERWRVTGVIALSDCNLKAIPDEVWDCDATARVLDISNNNIRDIPATLSRLSSLQKLLLNSNDIVNGFMCGEALKHLKCLTVLSLSQNLLTTLPKELGALVSLRQLDVGNNKLTSLPNEIKFLSQLQVLKANNNRISTITESIGDCVSLTEVDLSSNLLTELPETFGKLNSLKALHLSNNGLKSLPSTLFKMCLQLSTLDLHCTEITMDILRQLEGWDEFDDRRRLKHQKQLEFRVVNSAEFDEGADKN